MRRIYIILIYMVSMVGLQAADDQEPKPVMAQSSSDCSFQIVCSNNEHPITLLHTAKEELWKKACLLMSKKDPHAFTAHIMQHQLHTNCFYFLEVQKKHAQIEDFETLLEYSIKQFVPIHNLQALLQCGASSSTSYSLVYHDNEYNRTFTLVRQLPIFLAMWHGNVQAFKALYTPSITARLAHFTPEKKEDKTIHEPFNALASTKHSVLGLLEYMQAQTDANNAPWLAKENDVQQMIDHVKQAGASSCCLA